MTTLKTFRYPSPLDGDDVSRTLECASNTEDAEDAEIVEDEIPYHARQHARPFTYGNLPKGFKISELNHVEVAGGLEMPRSPQTQTKVPKSLSVLRRVHRPSISPSRPVLRKAPSRQEFEEMLMERREEALRNQSNVALRLAQTAAIQKDLDDLQERLMRGVAIQQQGESAPNVESVEDRDEIVRCVNTIDLPEDNILSGKDSESPTYIENSSIDGEHGSLVAIARRSSTPAFPVIAEVSEDRCASPYPMMAPDSPTLQQSGSPSRARKKSQKHRKAPSSQSSVNTNHAEPLPSEDAHDVAAHLVQFARDSSEFWYKPHMTRDESVALLRHTPPGTFVIRNSTTYENAFGLVLRVAKPPPGVPSPEEGGSADVLVRHFLLEPTTRGVRLRGSSKEPTFTSLSALVYQYSISPLGLPCRLIIPDHDLLLSSEDAELRNSHKQLLEQGAACNVLYLFTLNMESLTGDEAIRRAVHELYAQLPLSMPIEVHFKVSQTGITLTDNKRRLFFRRHYTASNVSHIGIDPDSRFFSTVATDGDLERTVNRTIFAFVARSVSGARDNQCHVFCDLAASQPASAIVSFANRVLPMDKSSHKML